MQPSRDNPLISIVTPAWNEADNLPVLYERLRAILDPLQVGWEWIVIDDHSRDKTFETVLGIARTDPRVHGLRFSRNSGSHIGITCGLHQARGSCAVIMAADLQDPPETLPQLLAEWQAGAQVVWAVRAKREGEKTTTIGFSRLYYWIMREIVGMKDMPSTGADFFLMDRVVLDAFREFSETNTSVLALITWMGFRQTFISYDKQARLHGKSGWNLEKKFKLVVDSVTAFTYVPIRAMTYAGFIFAALGFAYAAFVFYNALNGRPPEGWASLMIVVVLLGGFQMLMMGILGEYLWRALDEARRRPRYMVEASTDQYRNFSGMGQHG